MSSRLPGSRAAGFALQPTRHVRRAMCSAEDKKKKRRTDLGGERSPRSARLGLSRVRARVSSIDSRYFFRRRPTLFSMVKNIVRMRCIFAMRSRDAETVHNAIAESEGTRPLSHMPRPRSWAANRPGLHTARRPLDRYRATMRSHTRSLPKSNGTNATGGGGARANASWCAVEGSAVLGRRLRRARAKAPRSPGPAFAEP
jgi:hypothetical protein